MTKQKLFTPLLRLSKDIDKKVLLLTHIDIDAAGAAILIKLLYPNADIKYCTNGAMSREIKYHVTNNDIADNYDYILACDISLSEEDAEEVNACKNKSKFVLLDHHPSALRLNKYDWACCQVELLEDCYRKSKYYGEADGFSSGASLMYDYLEFNGMFDDFEKDELDFIKILIHHIASYDTWDWNNVFNRCAASDRLNTLSEIYDVELFVDKYVGRIYDCNYVLFNDVDKLFLSAEERKIASHRERIKNSFELRTLYHNDKYYSIVYAYGGEYMQDTFEFMKELYPDKDLYIINYGAGISLRSVKADINVGNIAMEYGGGGHEGAGGFKIPYEMLEEHMEQILRGTLYSVEE